MILFAALALTAAQATIGSQPAPVPAPPAAAAPPTPQPAAAQAHADDASLDLDQLRQMYRDTCSAREYGAYDDMCDQLRLQVREAERQAARAARNHPKVTPRPVSPP